MDVCNGLAIETYMWLYITWVAQVEYWQSFNSINSLFLINVDDIFKVNWNHSDLSNIRPLRGDMKLILIIIDFYK